MGTRSLTVFNNEMDNSEIVVLYRQYDGYPTGHGRDLLSFLNNMEIVNGISNTEKRRIANGMGCLSAQIVAHLKEAPGDFYLHSAGTRDIGEEFIYTLYYTEELRIKVQDTYDDGSDLFDGNMKSFKNWMNPQINPTNQDKNKDQECFFI
jgi:hypothetical protein|tara:strand:- start:471 stop:920 length:450 start_codon:yes stop_codon:yes gene_type:complete